jgi:hypothetical protein
MTYEELDFEINEECADYLVRIRQDLSAEVSLPQDVLDQSVGSPEGIYNMVMELKQLLKETEQMLLNTYKKKKELEEENQ